MSASEPAAQRATHGASGAAILLADACLRMVAGHWLRALNGFVFVFLVGGVAAPALAAVGLAGPANAVYAVYHAACHQWAFRSFFLFGSQAVYSAEQVQAMGGDPFTFLGGQDVGWKMAFCERDLAIYGSLLAFGVMYARRGRANPNLGLLPYAVLIAPMALDGFTQLFGWRESTWQLRVVTGLLFGAASAWLLYPRVDDALESFRHQRSPIRGDSWLTPDG